MASVAAETLSSNLGSPTLGHPTRQGVSKESVPTVSLHLILFLSSAVAYLYTTQGFPLSSIFLHPIIFLLPHAGILAASTELEIVVWRQRQVSC